MTGCHVNRTDNPVCTSAIGDVYLAAAVSLVFGFLVGYAI
jgi:hypothetical protein